MPHKLLVVCVSNLAASASKPGTNELVRAADVVVTMGCGDDCPYFSVRCLDWAVADPAGQPLAQVRAIREELRRRVADLVAQVTAQPAAIG